MSEGPPPKPRLTETEARERAGRALSVAPEELAAGTAHPWGWSFVFAKERVGSGPTFVDGRTGLVTTTAAVEHERIALLVARGPMGVPPFSPPPSKSWWQMLRGWFGGT